MDKQHTDYRDGCGKKRGGRGKTKKDETGGSKVARGCMGVCVCETLVAVTVG